MMTVVTPKRILLIDDETTIRDVVQVSLETIAGWEVMPVSSSQEGLALLNRCQPDAILLDLTMPGLDGIGFLRLLQINPEYPPIPIILITATADMTDTSILSELGVAAIICKPFNPLSLPGQIANLLGWGLIHPPSHVQGMSENRSSAD